MFNFTFIPLLIILIQPGQNNAAQNDFMMFNKFTSGEVYFDNGETIKAPLNYNTLNEEMMFIQAGDTLSLTNTHEIEKIVINNQSFVPSSKLAFYEKIEGKQSAIYIKHLSRLVAKGKPAAYGGYSETTSTTGYSNYSNSTTGENRQLKVDENIRYKNYQFCFVKINGHYKNISNRKLLTKCFKSQKKEIEEYLIQNDIDFDIPGAVLKLADDLKLMD